MAGPRDAYTRKFPHFAGRRVGGSSRGVAGATPSITPTVTRIGEGGGAGGAEATRTVSVTRSANTLLLAVTYRSGSDTFGSIADSRSGSYTTIGPTDTRDDNSNAVAISYDQETWSGAGNVIYTTAAFVAEAMMVVEVGGANGIGVQQTKIASTGAGSNAATGALTFDASPTHHCLIAIHAAGPSITPPAGWTLVDSNADVSRFDVYVSDTAGPGAGPHTFTFGASTHYAAIGLEINK